jgi:hypothetical protein
MWYQRVLDVSEVTTTATHKPSPMQVKRRCGDDSGPKVKRARLVYENNLREDDDDSDDDDSVHHFRRVQIIHKRKKRGAPLSATLTREDVELARKSTELQASLKSQTRIQASDWEVHKARIKELYSTHPLSQVMKILKAETGFAARCVPCVYCL